jgi:hypothetical protein
MLNTLTPMPASPFFQPVSLDGGRPLANWRGDGLPERLAAAMQQRSLRAEATVRGIPFRLDTAVVAGGAAVSCALPSVRAPWLLFLHCGEDDAPGGWMGHYVVSFADGRQARLPLYHEHQIDHGLQPGWASLCLEGVCAGDWDGVRLWLWAWRNPEPEGELTGLRLEPEEGAALILFGVSAGHTTEHPLRWEARRTVVYRLPEGAAPVTDEPVDPALLPRLDLGEIVHVQRRRLYPDARWEESSPLWDPEFSSAELLVEYTAHAEARWHFPDGRIAAVATAAETMAADRLRLVPPAARTVTLRLVEAGSGKPLAGRLHVHGPAGEYLAPLDHRLWPTEDWFTNCRHADLLCRRIHPGVFIRGETAIRLPPGPVFVEVWSGFERRPVRQVVTIADDTDAVTLELGKALPWRERGWVSADTHVHFLSPMAALLEGEAEGVNIVNLLAMQSGDEMVGMPEFDGRTTHGARHTGGDGEHLVRVGTENRQFLGHISLVGYAGPAILPLSEGESCARTGDPVATLLTEWARQCRTQGGVVLLSHFPFPRGEYPATLLHEAADAVEFQGYGVVYGGLNAPSLADWYRFLNIGLMSGAVGGTDKMSNTLPIGAVRTYAPLGCGVGEVSYEAWKEAVRGARTFVTCGPLLEFAVDGQPMGSVVALPASGGTITVEWEAASVVAPIAQVELIVNGEVRESASVEGESARGHWTVPLGRSAWLALRVRCRPVPQWDVIGAHSSPVRVDVGDTPIFSPADALDILRQLESGIAYFDELATRADAAARQRMRLLLAGAHRRLHNRLHEAGYDHLHTAPLNHHGRSEAVP